MSRRAVTAIPKVPVSGSCSIEQLIEKLNRTYKVAPKFLIGHCAFIHPNPDYPTDVQNFYLIHDREGPLDDQAIARGDFDLTDEVIDQLYWVQGQSWTFNQMPPPGPIPFTVDEYVYEPCDANLITLEQTHVFHLKALLSTDYETFKVPDTELGTIKFLKTAKVSRKAGCLIGRLKLAVADLESEEVGVDYVGQTSYHANPNSFPGLGIPLEPLPQVRSLVFGLAWYCPRSASMSSIWLLCEDDSHLKWCQRSNLEPLARYELFLTESLSQKALTKLPSQLDNTLFVSINSAISFDDQRDHLTSITNQIWRQYKMTSEGRKKSLKIYFPANPDSDQSEGEGENEE